ncbi:unnamed protein product [Phytophthora fragariaefolia]|uniref:Unnamed protein product n=1 Tax=Phytophthora fragariaefolia TaxID=1490495 RepID=A0A9W6TSJ5_9STRA|nr:unnamed protein product [Phytophthora fragariaefolia]
MAKRGESQTETDKTSEPSALLPEKITSEWTLDVKFLRARTAAISVVMACMFVGVTMPFAGSGVEVGSFWSNDLDATGQKDLLDRYNERLGSLTALMMKPLDITLSMVVAIIFLILTSKMSANIESRSRILMMIVIGVVGYLMNTGFNSINLQVVPGKIRPRIKASDLIIESVYDDSQQLDAEGYLTTTWDKRFRENVPGNSIRNTIYRSLFVPLEDVPSHCTETDDWYYSNSFKNVLPSYGFPSRTWQQYALSKALQPTATLSMPMKAAFGEQVYNDIDLPMNKLIATNLVVYLLVVSNTFLGWWSKEEEAWGGYSHAASTGKVGLADYFNITNRASGNSTFASNALRVIVEYYDKAKNASTSDELAKLEFTRINLTDTIVFDALTIEIPTQKYGVQSDNSSSANTFYRNLYSYTCNTKACLMADYEEYKADGNTTTIHPRVQALAICLNDKGEEDLVADYNYTKLDEILQSCTQRSNTSMMIISLGKRIAGDSFVTSPEDARFSTIVENARMVYSLTVGRLSWSPDNFSSTYHADCEINEGCTGIRFPLEGSPLNDHLLVTENGIPMNSLSPINLNWNWFPVSDSQWKMLASMVDEPRAALEVASKPSLIVLPRNFNYTDGESTMYTINSNFCLAYIDKHLNQIEKTHLYIEHTLQPAYTAGLYFIFQNAVRLKQLAPNNSYYPSSALLEFSGNIQQMFVQASVPTMSMLIAFVGCFVMVVCGITVAALGKLEGHHYAVTAVQALTNSEKFPPLMLHLRLRGVTNNELVEVPFDSLCVKHVVLVSAKDTTQEFMIYQNDIVTGCNTFDVKEGVISTQTRL